MMSEIDSEDEGVKQDGGQVLEGGEWPNIFQIPPSGDGFLRIGEWKPEPQGLKFELHGKVGEGNWFRLYECEHITEGSYPYTITGMVIPIGSHANLVLCKHCSQHIRGMILEEVFKQTLRNIPASQLMELFQEPATNPDDNTDQGLQSE